MEKFIKKDDAHYIINPSLTNGKKVDVFATEDIIKNFSDKTINQTSNTANVEGVHKINLNADAHEGYGCPIGSVVATEDIIMLGPIGYDISCSMSYIQTDIPYNEVESKITRREIIDKLCDYIPHGTGKQRAKKQAKIDTEAYTDILRYGASNIDLLSELDIPYSWIENLERTNIEANPEVLSNTALDRGNGQLGSLGSGNHFLEAQKVIIQDKEIAPKWGITETLGFMTHCGSRGIGHQIATEYFAKLKKYFTDKNIDIFDKELVYAHIDSKLGRDYYQSMGAAANFAIVNHLIINKAICSVLGNIFPGATFNFIYHISHNLCQKEMVGKKEYYIHRKGATRAFPAYHPALKETKFYHTGHPVIVPGSSLSGSSIMVGLENNEKNFHSTPHGSGRSIGRREAMKVFSQNFVNQRMDESDVLFNKRNYPRDEYDEVYKDYNEVIRSIEKSQLAKEVAKLKPIFVIKGT